MAEYRGIGDAEWFLRMADAEDESGSIAAGASVADEIERRWVASRETAVAIARLVQLARRARNLSVEDLGKRTGIKLPVLLAIEHAMALKPSPEDLHQLAAVLDLPLAGVQGLAEMEDASDNELAKAALQFAARCEPVQALSPEEENALRAFVDALGTVERKDV